MDEGIARSFRDMNGLPSVGLRYFNVYGPRMDVTGAYTEVFIRWLDCVDRGVRPQIHGDGSASMDFIYVDDIARANILAMESDREDDVYNVASGTETSLLDLWHAIQQVTGARPSRARSSIRRARSTRSRGGWPTCVGPVMSWDSRPKCHTRGRTAPAPRVAARDSRQSKRCWFHDDSDTTSRPMIPIGKPNLGEDEAAAARQAILSGWVTQGPQVKAFEDEFAAYVGAPHACAVSNCTTALHLALHALGVGPGDEVITVSHSFIATANAVRYCGAVPVFVDIDPRTYNIDPA